MVGLAVAELTNLRILIAEDEYMIADEIAAFLCKNGAVVIGPVASVEDALSLLADEVGLDAAVLDVNLFGQWIWPVVDVLVEQDVPIVLSTGYDSGAIPIKYLTLSRCEKPSTGHDIANAVRQATSTSHRPRNRN